MIGITITFKFDTFFFLFSGHLYIFLELFDFPLSQLGHQDTHWGSLHHHHHHVVLVAQISLTPQAGLLDNIPYPHIVAECMFVLIVLLLHGHVWGSTRVNHLWVRPCFSSSVLHVWFVTLQSISTNHTRFVLWPSVYISRVIRFSFILTWSSGYSLGKSYPSANMQSVCSAALSDWAWSYLIRSPLKIPENFMSLIL